MDIDEGMTETEIFKVGFTHANAARDAALVEYPNDVMLSDAFRHFSWNHMSTSDLTVGKLKTRTATINHEWGLLLLNPILNYYDDQYNYYVSINDPDAANKAFADSTLYIPNLKHDLVIISESSFSFFKGYFSVSNIMDLHNNVYGRAYPEKEPLLDYRDAFYMAKNNNELILDEVDVNDDHFYAVWVSEWYTY